MKKRLYTFIMALLLLSTSVNAAMYEEKNTKFIAPDVTLTNIKSFRSSGWQNINIVEANLDNEYISFGMLLPEKGIGSLETVKAMAEKSGPVVAVNGDFFARSGSQGVAGSPIGTVIKDGVLLSSAYEEENVCATLFEDEENTLSAEYLKTDITITSPLGNTAKVKYLNKYDSLAEICLYTKDFKDVTDGSYNNILEMVIENDTVVEMRREMEGVSVPENGYVIRHLPEYDPFLIENFNVGDKIEINITTNIDIDKIKTAIGTGTKLVENGKKIEITHNIKGKNPRTVAGFDESGKKLYLITIDGRYAFANGMTLEETADFLIEYGVFNAVNLDGGGSTTLVTKGENSYKVENTLSDGSLRRVTNGLALFSDAPTTSFASFDIECADKKVLKGTSRSFNIGNCYDKNYNILTNIDKKATWSIDSHFGYFVDNVFYPVNEGKNIEISATINNVTEKIYVDILSSPVTLEPSASHFNKKNITTEDFTLQGRDINGISALIEKRDINISPVSDGDIGYGKIEVLDAFGYYSYSPADTNSFEKKNFSFSGYPENEVKGKATLTDYEKKGGKYAVKLEYDFTYESSSVKASYINLDTPVEIKEKSRLGLWVYSPSKSNLMIKCQFQGQDDEFISETLTESIDFNGSKFLTCKIPYNAKALTKLYVVQNKDAEKLKGFVVLDDLTLFDTGEISFNNIKTEYNVSQQNPKDNTFVVAGGFQTGNTLLTKVLLSNASESLKNANALYCFSLDNTDFTGIEEIKINGYKSFTENNNLFITLNNSDAYLSMAQYEKLSYDIKEKNYKNLFVFMNEDMSLMSDKSELYALKKILSEAAEMKNVYVFFSADGDNMYKEDNVTYIAIKGIETSSASMVSENIDKHYFAKVTLDDNVKITFEKLINN